MMEKTQGKKDISKARYDNKPNSNVNSNINGSNFNSKMNRMPENGNSRDDKNYLQEKNPSRLANQDKINLDYVIFQ